MNRKEQEIIDYYLNQTIKRLKHKSVYEVCQLVKERIEIKTNEKRRG